MMEELGELGIEIRSGERAGSGVVGTERKGKVEAVFTKAVEVDGNASTGAARVSGLGGTVGREEGLK